MATVNSDVFQKYKYNDVKLRIEGQDSDGNTLKVEIREDEDQSLKLLEIVDLLVAAGYFRARIKGLSAFDKVVGGMTWCIESCNIDVDVDLLFQENLSIGQKIALTEKIVSVLPKMKCPYRIEPHQIQGLDFIHIFPIIQWLVKTSMEYRQEMSEFVQLYAVNQFHKYFGGLASSSAAFVPKSRPHQINESLDRVLYAYRPQRYYQRKTMPQEPVVDSVHTRVLITLLEYGLGAHHCPATASLTLPSLPQREDHELQIEEIMKGMITSEEFVDSEMLSPEQKVYLLKHYESLEAELQGGGCRSILQTKYLLQKEQKSFLEQQEIMLLSEKSNLKSNICEIMNAVAEIDRKQQQIHQNFHDLVTKDGSSGGGDDNETLRRVEELVVIHENLKDQELRFREHCKVELLNLQTLIQKMEESRVPEVLEVKKKEELEHVQREMKSVRLRTAKKVRAIAAAQRQLDEIPTRPELAQYQRRFLELYNQVSAKHKETKQYYTLYNTLDDTRLYIKKELNVLNSILDSYPEAMQTSMGKEDFLRQFETIVQNVRLMHARVGSLCADERRKRDELGQRLLALVEQQRRYVAALKQLDTECRRTSAFN